MERGQPCLDDGRYGRIKEDENRKMKEQVETDYAVR
jgi:hypothetical protein